jgi:hypothetical protein
MKTAYILIWLFSSNFSGDHEAYTGSARFDDLKACQQAAKAIRKSRMRKHDLCECFPAGLEN